MHDCGCAGHDVPAGPRHLDVRPMLAAGREPFGAIIEAVDALAPGQPLVLRSPFDPVPLHRVLAGRGFWRESRRLADDDWETVYHPEDDRGDADVSRGAPPAAAGAGTTGAATATTTATAPAPAITLDVRGLLPPEPLERTLAALERLGPGQRLLQINERVPAFLLPLLDERGYVYALERDGADVRLTVWQAGGAPR